MSYAELLKDERWKDKSLSIKKRDEFKCQLCFNKSPLEEFEISRLRLTIIKGKLTLFTRVNEDGEPIRKISMTDLKIDKFFKKYKQEGKVPMMLFSYDENKDSDFFSHIGTFLLLEDKYEKETFGIDDSIKSRQIHEYEKKLKTEILTSLYKELEWLELKLLHTHHQYYQLNKMPWEYPDSALITLCWNCHENLHKNNKIKVYDENMNLDG